MTITLPFELHAKAVERAKRFGFPSVEAYLADLVEGDDGDAIA